MNSKDTAYMARVNVAVWLIRKAGKIARRLNGTTPEQRQAVEDEIVAIGQKMYDEMRQVVEDEIAAVGREMYGDTRQQPQPEVTHDPHARAKSRYEFGDESERDAYVADVVDQIAESTPEPDRLRGCSVDPKECKHCGLHAIWHNDDNTLFACGTIYVGRGDYWNQFTACVEIIQSRDRIQRAVAVLEGATRFDVIPWDGGVSRDPSDGGGEVDADVVDQAIAILKGGDGGV